MVYPKYLIIHYNVFSGLLTRDPSDRYSSCRRLNLARLLLVYVRAFQASDPIEAINYFYFLRDVRGPRGDNLYMACVAELVLESREFDLLLGSIGPDGTRQPGLVDKLQNSFSDTQQVIESVAQESESRGMLEDSVMLFDLAQKHEKVVDLLNKLLSQVHSIKGSSTTG